MCRVHREINVFLLLVIFADGLTDQRGVLISGAVGGVAGLIVVVAMVLALLKIKFAMRSRRDAREDN